MRSLLIGACCVALWASLAHLQAPGAASVPLGPDDVAAVEALVARYSTAREISDPAAIATLFVPDADQLVSTGEWRRGREALVQGMLGSSRSRPGRRTIQVERVRGLAQDVALADARYEIGDQGGEARRMWSTFVVQRTPDGWRIAAIRNMLPAR